MQVKTPFQEMTTPRHGAKRLPIALAITLSLAIVSCQRGPNVPSPGSPQYLAAIRAFYVGLSALQVGDDVRAEARLTEATQLAPGEPSAWANLGLLHLRHTEFDKAAENLNRAQTLAPDSGHIHSLLALLESNRGNYSEAISNLRRAIELNPTDLKALYMLASEIEREAGEGNEAEVIQLLERVLAIQPENLAVQLDLGRLAARRGDSEGLQRIVSGLAQKAPSWPQEVQEQFQALQKAAADDPGTAAARVQFLRNVLVRVPEYQQSLAAVKLPPDIVGEPLTRLYRLETPSPKPAIPDDGLTFATESLGDASDVLWVGAFSLTGEGSYEIAFHNGREIQFAGGTKLAFPGVNSGASPLPDSVAALDFDYDFRMDLAVAGPGGFRLYKQGDDGSFSDVTAGTRLPGAITRAELHGVWVADIEADGDLDIVIAPRQGPALVLQNNGDGSFQEIRPFQGVDNPRGFAWADIDADGDADAAFLLASGEIKVFANERGGQFRSLPMPSQNGSAVAIAAADIDNDGRLDFLALRNDGLIQRLTYKDSEGLIVAELVRWSTAPASMTPGLARLFVADLDNNGSLDLVAASLGDQPAAGVWLSNAQAALQPVDTPLPPKIFAAHDTNADGLIDLLATDANKQPVRALGKGTRNYHWQVIRPRAQEATGDQRINSFGIGGEVEIRAGLLTQKQPITGPLVHFGLGEQLQTDVARIIWPNGVVQAEFELKGDEAALAEQRLKGSCPWVFAFDGERMSFVTDTLWRSPLGLKINAQDTAGVMMTEEWVKIRGDQLRPRDGFYDVRITAELWETHFFDHVSLLVVDHPVGTEIFVDERFAVPPPPLRIHPLSPLKPFAGARDDGGRDVSEIVQDSDGNYLDNFGRGRYQGITRPHFVELELPAEAPHEGPLWLVGSGWIHPTDSSINVAVSQGDQPKPESLSLEVADGSGGWVTVRSGLGFPAGKIKTVLLDLTGVFRPSAPRRLRLKTNMEIYWDRLAWASGLSSDIFKSQRLNLNSAELRFRGYSAVSQANKSSPELPDYSRLGGTAPRWFDLVGYHTRFGDVMALLATVDDRYVIMNAGDEMVLKFSALPPPPEGWVRDFVLICDGWEKDGDLNTAFSKTVLPLPTHASGDYTTAPTRLEDDPVYRRYPQDWRDYHTRYVTPNRLSNALRQQ
ncbi:MAG TPA: FG-GAP-like repeat-containing protein [Pyrinomonadaceae bacterium]|nr:FG-GAP-like repeat-containing protein [Pyrinomonadaceae bacterium]